MKFNLHVQHRRQREGAPNISLFPFLAVLICTMGALVPLLFAITRQARMQAARTAVAKIAEKKAEIRTEHETMQWRIEQLKTSRKKTDGQVSDSRLELGHLEDHARDLREKIPALEKTVAELDKLDGDDNRQRSQQVEELQKLRAQIEAAKKQVTDAQMEAASRKKSYAIVPYEGPNQTYRRPIYLECRADAVVLQPEGIEFPVSDFEGPLGPGNPLASTLRAVREYLLANHTFDPQRDGEPYPLLLVRPDGIAAYYAARAAMTSWATEFGYELIEADWKLAYQPPDAQMAKVVQEVLLSARARQQRLIAAAPAAYSKKTKATYRASPGRGGSVRMGGSDYDDEDAEDSAFVPRRPSGRVGSAFGPSGTGSAEGDSSGPTEAEQVASLYGNTGGGTANPGGQLPGGQLPGGQGGSSGSGYGPAIAGGVGGNVSEQGTQSGGYGTGTGTGTKNGTIGGGNGSLGGGSANPGGQFPGGQGGSSGSGYGPAIAGGAGGNVSEQGTQSGGYGTGTGTKNGTVGGGNGAVGYGDGAVGRGVAGSASGTDNTGAGLAGQGSSKGNTILTDGGYIPQYSGQGSSNKEQSDKGPSDKGSGDKVASDKRSSKQIMSSEGYIVGQPPTEINQPDQKSQTSAERPTPDEAMGKPVMPLRPGEWRESAKPPPFKADDEKPDEKKNGKHPKSLASKRGPDWALPDAAHGSVPVTRPIKVECRADQLIIVPEAGLSGGKTIPLDTRTEASTQAFISAVWEHMETWGIAGRGMYWRPVLNIYVAPGAEQRFADLQMLLDGSGLKIVRK